MGEFASSNTAIIDTQRVDVDPGPWGTLFGRNTISGANDAVDGSHR